MLSSRPGATRSGDAERAAVPSARASLEPLSEDDFEGLEALLADPRSGSTMHIEQSDGFFCGLLAGPRVSKPCQFWPVVFGKPVADPPTLDYIRSTTVLLPLLARHWYTIEQVLQRGAVYPPYFTTDVRAADHGHRWARGFMQAVELQIEGWRGLLAEEEQAGALLPMMILAHEEDPNRRLQGPRIAGDARRRLVMLMAAGMLRAHRYFTLLTPSPNPTPPLNWN